MSTVCFRKTLLDAVRTAYGLTKSLRSLPQLHGRVRIADHSGSYLAISGTNLDVAVETYVESGGDADFSSIVVDGKALVEVLRLRNDAREVELSVVDDERLRVQFDDAETVVELKLFDSDDWPVTVFAPPSAPSISVKVRDLRAALSEVAFAASRDVSRESLRGVVFRDGKAIASDGKRIAIRELPGAELLIAKIPTPAIEALLRVLPGNIDGEPVSIFNDAGTLWFLSSAGSVTTRELAGGFPDYESLLPTEFVAELPIELKTLRSAVGLAVASQGEKEKKDRIVEFVIDERGFRIGAPGAPAVYEEAINDVDTGTELRVAYTPEYLVDAAKALRAGIVTLKIPDARGATLLCRDGWTYGFMPVLIK